MIELLLQAERTLTAGMVDQAERLYWQVAEADPRNTIAIVGLARCALERGDEQTAYTFGRKALDLDPENLAARRLVERLAEVMAYRGETPPAPSAAAAGPAAAEPAPAEASRTGPTASDASANAKPPVARPRRKRGLLRRLFGG